MKATFRETCEGDAECVAPRMRALDIKELEAHGIGPKDALLQSIERSEVCNTVIIDGKPEGVFGISRVIDGGLIWFLCTDKIKGSAFSAIKLGRLFIEEQLDNYQMLYNFVHAEHEEAQHFIALMGFDLTHHASINNHNFYRFERRRDRCVSE